MSDPHPVPGTIRVRRRKHSRLRRVLVAIGVCLVVLLGALTVGGFVLVHHLNANLTTEDVSGALGSVRPTQPIVPDVAYQPENILIMGTDSRIDQGSGFGTEGCDCSDTTVLIHLSADRKHAIALSIPRDTWVTVPSCERSNGSNSQSYQGKFNSAFSIGGPACTIKTVESMTDVRVDHFIVVDFDGFRDLIDALGGVQVCFTTPVDDPESHLVLPAGYSTLNGTQALGVVRARKTLGDGSDISRIDRQQALMTSLAKKISDKGLLLNPVKLYSVLNVATKAITVDPGLGSVSKLADLARSLHTIPLSNITFVTMPWVSRGDGSNVLMDVSKTQPILDAMNDDTVWPVATPTPSSSQPTVTVTPSSIRVKVLNGAGVKGAAAKAAAQLEAQGFTVVSVGDAPVSTYTTPVVEYDPAYDESARTLTTSITGATSIAKSGLGKTLVVIVGTQGITVVPVVVDSSSATPSTSTGTPAYSTANQSICRTGSDR
jgi:LCP family protein required for cell wall assembly